MWTEPGKGVTELLLLGHLSHSLAGDGGGGYEIPLHGEEEAHHHQHQHVQQGEVQQPLEEDVLCPSHIKGQEGGGRRREAGAAETKDCSEEELGAVEEGEGLEYGKSAAEKINGRAKKRLKEVEGRKCSRKGTGESQRGANDGLLDNSWGRASRSSS